MQVVKALMQGGNASDSRHPVSQLFVDLLKILGDALWKLGYRILLAGDLELRELSRPSCERKCALQVHLISCSPVLPLLELFTPRLELVAHLSCRTYNPRFT